MTVEVKLSTDGWVFACKNRQAGPFRNLNAIDFVQVATELSGLDQQAVEEWEAYPGENIEKWTTTPKDVLKAKLRECGIQDPGHKKKSLPAFPQSVFATCLKKRFWDVGDCDDFGCRYLDWCLLQLRALSIGAVLLFYEKAPTKCSICHRRKATRMFFVERDAHAPNSVFVTCSACVAKLPQHWKILKTEELPLDY